MGNYLETLTNIAKSKDKKVENLIFAVILLVVVLIALSYIFKDDKEKNNNANLVVNSNNTSQNENINSSDSMKTNMEQKMANILSQISGISDASVMITYSKDNTTTPIYNTKEYEKQGEKTVEKSVAYNEQNSSKTAIIESIEMPKVEGVIIVAKGSINVEMKSKIATAISALTNVPVYKIQIFEKDT